jgi:AcrR family transcriptional regulator
VPRPRTIDDEAVLDAAARVVGRTGPAGLTLAAVAAESGLAPATLVQRFGSKRRLLLAVVARGVPVGSLREAAMADDPLAALVDALVARTASIVSPEVLANHVAFLQMDLADPEFHAHARADAARLQEALEAVLRAAEAGGGLRGVEVPAMARALRVTYNGTLVTWAVDRDGELASVLRRELEAVLAPYRTGEPASPDR